jgi:hypothetical protein
MFKTCSMRTSARLGLLQQHASGRVLVFEAPRASGGQQCCVQGSPRHMLVSASDATADVVASSIGLSNTLLSSALHQQQARFVLDCGTYMQSCVRPARDIFTSSCELVSAIVVVPLLAAGEEPLGGLYFATDTPCDFTHNQDTLLVRLPLSVPPQLLTPDQAKPTLEPNLPTPNPPLSTQGFIHAVTPLLHQRLANQADSFVGMAAGPKGSSPTVSFTSSGGASPGSADVLSSSIGSSCAQNSRPLSHVQSSGRLTKLTTANRANTDAMLQVLQQDIRQKGRRTSMSSANELVVGELLGRGGFGSVYKGERLATDGGPHWTAVALLPAHLLFSSVCS